MTNPDNVGGLRLFDSQWVNIVNHDNCYRDYTKEEAVAMAVKLTEQKMAENVELCRAAPTSLPDGDLKRLLDAAKLLESNGYSVCRAAPAGGECQHEWQPDADVMNARYCPKCDVTQTMPRKFRGVGELERTGYIRAGSADERDARDEQEYDDELCFPEHEVEAMKLEAVQDAAPAGSVEVEELAKLFEEIGDSAQRSLTSHVTVSAKSLRDAAALLRKLQQGADGCHRILFSGEVMRETDEMVTDEGQWSNVRPPFIGMRYQNHMRTVRRSASQDQEGK